ncbi:segregation and condensation protein A [Sulfuricystis multivorans]|uniref:segregation and condensation protein A n=1 Tax=Sulfuricystis multivorans TaxID=2211108 RepID=UPI000F83CF1B|nr:ScpA family protein [Sulfuricystis multivorans]
MTETAQVGAAGTAPGAQAHVPKLYGEPLPELPRDLYIPPDALEVFLDAFEGPLDLLLYLIRKANVNILDIPMAPLTAQYLAYVEAMRRSNLELAADYLLMAAMLLEIKSRMLLPRPTKTESGEPDDPRAELVRRLMEYERIKLAAARLDALPQVHRDYEWASVWVAEKVAARAPEVNLNDLLAVWLTLMQRARVKQHHRVQREELSVRETMSVVLRHLQGRGYVMFEELFAATAAQAGMAGMIVSFLAILELARESLIEITQSEALAPIYVKMKNDAALQA